MIQTSFKAEGEGGEVEEGQGSRQTFCQIFFVINTVSCFQFFGINTLLACSTYYVATAEYVCGSSIEPLGDELSQEEMG